MDANNDKRELQRRIAVLEQQLVAYASHNKSLQDYLDLFLNHPVYKIYRFFKRFVSGTTTNNSGTKNALHYQTYQVLYEPGLEKLRQQKRIAKQLSHRPKFEIVTAVFRPPLDVLEGTIGSVIQQTYDDWTWNVIDASCDDGIRKYLSSVEKRDARITVELLTENKGISGNLNVALRKARGDYIVFLDHDDLLAPHALFSVAQLVNDHPDADFVYSDCDKLDNRGHRCDPLFKSGWSPETMLSCNLMNQISVFRSSLLDNVGFLNSEFDGAQDWDFYLRIIETTNRIYHVPDVLYHWRKSPQSTALATENKPYVRKAQLAAITAHLQRRGFQDAQAFFLPDHPVHGTHPLVQWTPSKRQRISIVIPSKDCPALLRRCLHSIRQKTSYENYQIIIVDTGSTDAETLRLYEENRERLEVVHYSGAFNFSRACNLGAKASSGDVLLFLNNDTEVLHSDWLELMLQWFDVKDIGIVGAKLLYPTGEIQHAGVVIGLGGIASHLFRDMKENTDTIFGSDCWYRNLSAVTAACLMIRSSVFDSVGGFDEQYVLNYSDVDLCYRVREKGFRILYTPHVRLIHHEGVTHKGMVPRADFERAYKQLSPILQSGDPFFHPMLSWKHAVPRIRFSTEETCSSVNTDLMANLPVKEYIMVPEDFPVFAKLPTD